MADKFIEKDILFEVKVGINAKKKKLLKMVVIKYDPATNKGKAIGQILDGIKKLL